MSFSYNAEGISLDGPLLPEKTWFAFRVVKAQETKSRGGEYQVIADSEVINDAQWNGVSVRNFLTFKNDKNAPGAGIPIHFLKCIDQPWEGNIEINALDWEGQPFEAQIVVEEYEGKKRNKFKTIRRAPEDFGPPPPLPPPVQTGLIEEELPF